MLSINIQYRRLILFFNWLVDCGPNDCNPMSSIGAPKLAEKTVPVITEGRMRNKPDSEIFQRDVGWIHEADIIVAEATMPSLGVGCELGFGESVGKPVICLHRERDGRRLSAMIAGNPRVRVRAYAYQDVDEAVKLVKDFIHHRVARGP